MMDVGPDARCANNMQAKRKAVEIDRRPFCIAREGRRCARSSGWQTGLRFLQQGFKRGERLLLA